MSKVFVLQDNPYSPKDFSSAEEYGEITFLFDRFIPTHAIKRTFSQIREKFRHLSKDDWIVPVGHPALIALAGVAAYERIGQINMLVYDQQSGTYMPLRIDAHGSNGTIDGRSQRVVQVETKEGGIRERAERSEQRKGISGEDEIA